MLGNSPVSRGPRRKMILLYPPVKRFIKIGERLESFRRGFRDVLPGDAVDLSYLFGGNPFDIKLFEVVIQLHPDGEKSVGSEKALFPQVLGRGGMKGVKD